MSLFAILPAAVLVLFWFIGGRKQKQCRSAAGGMIEPIESRTLLSDSPAIGGFTESSGPFTV